MCYRAKALTALNNTEEALKYIKQALSIKYNKTLFKYLTDLETKQRKLSDDILFNKLQEQHLKNLKLNNFNISSCKISENNDVEKLHSNNSKRNSKESSFSKEKKPLNKESTFEEVSISIIKNNHLNSKKNFNSEVALENNKILKVNSKAEIKKYNNNNNLNNKEKSNFTKILNETSLDSNLISDNRNYNNNNNTVNDSLNKSNLNNKDDVSNNNISFYSSSRIKKIIKIMFMYLVQYLRKHKAIVCLLTLIFLIMKRKSIVGLLRKILGK